MYRLKSEYKITQEQQRVVDSITGRYRDSSTNRQVLLGVTGSGKTFTMAHIIHDLGVPALILSPNKTLAAQLYQEFMGFFPDNPVGYFISYYDYYQPEAFVPQRNMYIAKEVSINPELERLRIEAVRSLLESKSVIIVASVSAIYSIGSPDDFVEQKCTYARQQKADRENLLRDWVELGYSRTEDMIESGKFRVRGSAVELFPTSEENPIRFVLGEGDRIEEIVVFDGITGEPVKELDSVNIFPISYFHYKKSRIEKMVGQIRMDLDERVSYFLKNDKPDYAKRLKERTLFDIEMLEQYGHCPGIENYSLYLTGRKTGEAPYTLMDFFKGEFITILDESHITIPQLRGMYEGDRSRKETLVKYGFRLPSALDNRPLNFFEINERFKRVLYVSATPAPYEVKDTDYKVTELLVRPTGLLDPVLEPRNVESPVEDMQPDIQKEIEKNNRVLITTLTKKMSEKLADYLSSRGIQCTYLHSEIKSLDRIKILKKLRSGDIDVLIGINLLREGLDLPEVSLVIILDADREGFLRTETSLVQTFGRAARHERGRVILYYKEYNKSLKSAINESHRRRDFQMTYNKDHEIEPVSIQKRIKDFYDDDYWIRKSEEVTDENFTSREGITKEIDKLTRIMKKKAENLDFKEAARLKKRVIHLKNLQLEMF